MTDDTVDVATHADPRAAPLSVRRMLQVCPVCTGTEVARLAMDWEQQVAAGGAIPIVGCGNPWHYDTLGLAVSEFISEGERT